MNDMKHFSDNIFGFSVCRPCSPSEGVRKTQENARLRGKRRKMPAFGRWAVDQEVDPNDPKLVQSLTYEFQEILE